MVSEEKKLNPHFVLFLFCLIRYVESLESAKEKAAKADASYSPNKIIEPADKAKQALPATPNVAKAVK